MLCPEVSNFKVPYSSFEVEKLDDGKLPNKNISNFYYNHLLSVIIPDTLIFPENLTKKFIVDSEYYQVTDLNLGDLIDFKFLCSFVKSGKLTLLSVDTRIDCDNCIGIIPTGQLILSVNKETYQSLGLEGKVSHFTAKIKNRYIIKIDLKEEKLQPGKPYYMKTKSRLQTLGKFTVVLLWEPPEEEICPSSIAKYFFDVGYKVKVCTPNIISKTLYSVNVPEIDFNNADENTIIDFVDWLGMVSIDGDVKDESEKYVTSYETPLPHRELGQVKHMQWRGLFSTAKIKELIAELIKYNQVENKPWITVYVQGFSDSPVAWGIEEHHYYTNGDNGYLIILNNEKYLCCLQKCSKRRYK